MKLKECKGQSSSIPTYPVSEEYFIAPVGVVFVKVTKGMQLMYTVPIDLMLSSLV